MLILGLALSGGTLWLMIRALRYAQSTQRPAIPQRRPPVESDTIDANTVLAWTAPDDATVFDTHTAAGGGHSHDCQTGDSSSGGDGWAGDCASGDSGSSDGGSSGSWD